MNIETELKSLISQRGQIKSSLTRFQSFKFTFEDNGNITTLQLRKNDFVSLLTKFNEKQDRIEELDDSQKQLDERITFENQYYSLLTWAEETIEGKKLEQSRSPTPNVSNLNIDGDSIHTPNHYAQIKLPTLNLPSFNGQFEKWLPFNETYHSLIHSDQNLSDIQKFHYLKSCLSGDAAKAIESLQVTSENYKVAYDILKKRYESKRLTIKVHINAIFNLPLVTKNSATSLRQLIDVATAHVKILTNLKLPTQHWNALLNHLLITKVDYITKREWEMSLKDDDSIPTFNDLLEFLHRRCKLLESVEFDKSAIQHSTHTSMSKGATHRLNNNRTIAHAVTANKVVCLFCKQTHFITQCRDFQKLNIDRRIKECNRIKLCTNCLKANHSTSTCYSLNTCRECKQKHHTLLHKPEIEPSSSQVESQPCCLSISNQCYHSNGNTIDILSTAVVHIRDNQGNYHNCRAFLDSGSQSNFITKDLCDKLKIKLKPTNKSIGGLGRKITRINESANITIKSRFNAFTANLDCLVLNKITDDLPTTPLNASCLEIPSNIKLADPEFYKTKQIDMLIGTGLFWNLLKVGQIKLKPSQPYFQKTELGWIVGGTFNAINKQKTSVCNLAIEPCVNSSLETHLKRFWELEECVQRQFSLEETACEEHFQRTFKRNIKGQFIVQLPFKTNAKQLGQSMDIALKRFRFLETKLSKQPILKKGYGQCIDEYIGLEHMELVPPSGNNTDTGYYLPHHAVIKNDSKTTKLRVVFDGSAKSDNGTCLNDQLMVGPTIQEDLFSIITRFRTYKFVFTADIVKMYRQILVDAEHRTYQRILWRTNSTEPIQTYQLKTVTFGTSAAPFLAIRCLQQLAKEEKRHYPKACETILNDFYVDDLITGANNLKEAIKLRDQIIRVLRNGTFSLNKWAANNAALLPNTHDNSTIINFDKYGDTKALGLLWNCVNDTFKYSIKHFHEEERVTKRKILSTIAKLFDPLGLVGPIIINAKLIMQRLWSVKAHWDESVPIDLYTTWKQFTNQLPLLNQLTIPRMCTVEPAESVFELHGFCDASERAYGACIYIKSTVQTTNTSHVRLLCARSKVAPLKTITLPRLELCGALLLANLVNKLKLSLNLKISSFFLWTDSSIVLSWVSAPPNKWKTFVCNRVADIQRVSNINDWRHINGKENPADLLSRGSAVEHLLTKTTWWHGPEWLVKDITQWPQQTMKVDDIEIPDAKRITLSVTQTITLPVFSKYSSYIKLQHVIAYVLRFINNARPNNEARLNRNITCRELEHATIVIVKYMQRQEFSSEIRDLRNDKQVHHKSRLSSLNPFIDNKGLIRVGGRLRNSNITYDKKFPIVLPHNHHITKLLITQEHGRMLHAGNQATLASLRQRFWLLSGRNTVRQVLKQCMKCFRAKPTELIQMMGDLPLTRIQPRRPFLNSGVDFAGPILIKEGRGRGKRSVKAYIALFICFCTKAVHLELVSDLTSEAFLNALKRFISRRGNVLNLYSDNATNFVGTKRELDRLSFLFKGEHLLPQIENDLAKTNITWHFIPPRSPHFGGIWEAGIKSAKTHLKRVIGESVLTYDEMCTFLTRVEACLNSRPITPISSDPNDLTALTPSHFLIGDLLTAPVEPDLRSLKINTLSRWQYIEQLRQHFWSRWHREYLHTLQQRSKWKKFNAEGQLKPGSLVLLKDENLPPLRWKLGRIVDTKPGNDSIVRVVTIKTASGITSRAVARVCVLPIDCTTE